MRSPKLAVRPYRMTRRAEAVDRTRDQITRAAVRLHTSVGPAKASIAAIAEEAGVTRLTVYRHFADQDAIFEACTSHWLTTHRPPSPAAWATIEDPATRVRVALTAIYGWFRANVADLWPIYRDYDDFPPRARQKRVAERAALADSIVGSDAGEAVRGLARHLVDIRAWHALAIEEGLADETLVGLGVRLLA